MSFEMYLIQSEFDNNDTLLSFFFIYPNDILNTLQELHKFWIIFKISKKKCCLRIGSVRIRSVLSELYQLVVKIISVFFRICHPNRVELVWASLLTVVKIVCSLFGY